MKRIRTDEVAKARIDPVDTETIARAHAIVTDVRLRGEAALREYAEKFGDLEKGAPLVIRGDAFAKALASLDRKDRDVLERTAKRISTFAIAQKNALAGMVIDVPGGSAGHEIAPMERAGCYAPGGRYPLPSTVLMTAVTARVAGVREVWVASPKPSAMTLAACAVAGVDALLAVGGAQSIAALAHGAGDVPACDVIVGPGNRYVTAAKQVVSGNVAIDMLAGPSELVVIADSSADPDVVAADLLAQAEHDPDALPVLITWDESVATAVDAAIERALVDLSTKSIAQKALENGFTVIATSPEDAAHASNLLAPEHLEVQVRDLDAILPRLEHYGALFLGPAAAEVFGDYGVGPNHVLPTGGRARFVGGLSVFTFLRVRTWLRMDHAPASLVEDVAALARHEGLEAHARAAEARVSKKK